jgi:hypothetical protein
MEPPGGVTMPESSTSQVSAIWGSLRNLRIRILAKEIGSPIVREHALTVEGEIKKVDLEDLESLMLRRQLDSGK